MMEEGRSSGGGDDGGGAAGGCEGGAGFGPAVELASESKRAQAELGGCSS